MKKIKKVHFFAEKSEKKPNFAARKSKRELSSVGSEHRPYKAGVDGSSPTVPTKVEEGDQTFGHPPFYAPNGIPLILLKP